MFGYACDETREYMPATLILAQVIMKELAVIARAKATTKCPISGPTPRAQVTDRVRRSDGMSR